jgi:hypothetical protein
VYHDNIGGTRNEAADMPTSAPANMRIRTVFMVEVA